MNLQQEYKLQKERLDVEHSRINSAKSREHGSKWRNRDSEVQNDPTTAENRPEEKEEAEKALAGGEVRTGKSPLAGGASESVMSLSPVVEDLVQESEKNKVIRTGLNGTFQRLLRMSNTIWHGSF